MHSCSITQEHLLLALRLQRSTRPRRANLDLSHFPALCGIEGMRAAPKCIRIRRDKHHFAFANVAKRFPTWVRAHRTTSHR